MSALEMKKSYRIAYEIVPFHDHNLFTSPLDPNLNDHLLFSFSISSYFLEFWKILSIVQIHYKQKYRDSIHIMFILASIKVDIFQILFHEYHELAHQAKFYVSINYDVDVDIVVLQMLLLVYFFALSSYQMIDLNFHVQETNSCSKKEREKNKITKIIKHHFLLFPARVSLFRTVELDGE